MPIGDSKIVARRSEVEPASRISTKVADKSKGSITKRLSKIFSGSGSSKRKEEMRSLTPTKERLVQPAMHRRRNSDGESLAHQHQRYQLHREGESLFHHHHQQRHHHQHHHLHEQLNHRHPMHQHEHLRQQHKFGHTRGRSFSFAQSDADATFNDADADGSYDVNSTYSDADADGSFNDADADGFYAQPRSRSSSFSNSDADADADADAVSGDQWIANALTSKLYLLLTGEQGGASNGKTFFSVIRGGLPFNEKSLSFLTDGQKDNDSRVRARRFAEIANTIPNSVGDWASSGGKLDSAFDLWLNTAMYPKIALEPKYTDALIQAKKIIAANYKDYSRYRGDYQRALSEYNAKKLLNPNDPTLPALKDAYNNAMEAWEAIGSRVAVESALAEKNKLERNGWATAFQDLRANFDTVKAESTYLPVEVVPEDFMTDETLWSTYKFSSTEAKDHEDSSSRSWGGSAGVSYGLFGFSGSASGSESHVNVSNENTEMSVEFQYCRTSLIRSWFDSYVLLSQSWWYNGATRATPTAGGPILSDGKNPPAGTIPMIPTEAVWIRNLKVRFAKGSTTVKQVQKSLQTAAKASYWLFSVGASYGQESSSLDKVVKTTDSTVEFTGTSLAGFLCRVMDKTPDPLPEFLPLNRDDLLQKQADADPSADIIRTRKPAFAVPTDTLNKAVNSIKSSLTNYIKGSTIMDHLKSKAVGYFATQGENLKSELKKKAINYLGKQAKIILSTQKARLERLKVIGGLSVARETMYDHPYVCTEKPLQPKDVIESANIAALENTRNLPESKDHLPDLSAGKGEHHALSIAILTAKKWGPSRKILNCLFLDGAPVLMTKVAQVASTWTQYTGITLKFYRKSGTKAATGVNVVPSDLVPEIRISFLQAGNWSLVGTDCLLGQYQGQATMNFGSLKEGSQFELIRRAVLHEFGHAMGAIHEHQNPNGNIQWNQEVVFSYYRAVQGWNDDQIRHNIFDKYAVNQTNASAYDPTSIMHYPIPAEHLLTGEAVPLNTDLSSLDKSFMRSIYGVGSSGATSDVSADADAPLIPDGSRANSYLTVAHDVSTGAISHMTANALRTIRPAIRGRGGLSRNVARGGMGVRYSGKNKSHIVSRQHDLDADADADADADGNYNDADADADADGNYNDADADGNFNDADADADADATYNDADADADFEHDADSGDNHYQANLRDTLP